MTAFLRRLPLSPPAAPPAPPTAGAAGRRDAGGDGARSTRCPASVPPMRPCRPPRSGRWRWRVPRPAPRRRCWCAPTRRAWKAARHRAPVRRAAHRRARPRRVACCRCARSATAAWSRSPAGRHGAGRPADAAARAAGSGRWHRGPAGLAAGRSHHALSARSACCSARTASASSCCACSASRSSPSPSSLLTIGGAVYAFMLRSLAPLQRVVRFARPRPEHRPHAAAEERQPEVGRADRGAQPRLAHAAAAALVAMRDGEARVHSLLDATPDAIPPWTARRASP